VKKLYITLYITLFCLSTLSPNLNAFYNKKNNQDLRPIHRAAQYGSLKKVKNFIERDKININTRTSPYVDSYDDNCGFFCSEKQHTPLYYAAQEGHMDIVRYLIEHNAKITNNDILIAKNQTIKTYLKWATTLDNSNKKKYFVEKTIRKIKNKSMLKSFVSLVLNRTNNFEINGILGFLYKRLSKKTIDYDAVKSYCNICKTLWETHKDRNNKKSKIIKNSLLQYADIKDGQDFYPAMRKKISHIQPATSYFFWT